MDSRVALLGSGLVLLGTAVLLLAIPTNSDRLRLTAVFIGCSISVGLGVLGVIRQRAEASRWESTEVGWASGGLVKSTLRVSLMVWFVALATSAVVSVVLEENFQSALARVCLFDGIVALIAGGVGRLSVRKAAPHHSIPHVLAFPLAAAQLLAVWLLIS
jgi:hypothetical protein